MRQTVALALLTAAMMTTPAKADFAETLGYSITIFYSDHCEQPPAAFLAASSVALLKANEAEGIKAMQTLKAVYDKNGHDSFCARTKPIIDKSAAELERLTK
jgi:hypothetical protein